MDERTQPDITERMARVETRLELRDVEIFKRLGRVERNQQTLMRMVYTLIPLASLASGIVGAYLEHALH